MPQVAASPSHMPRLDAEERGGYGGSGGIVHWTSTFYVVSVHGGNTQFIQPRKQVVPCTKPIY